MPSPSFLATDALCKQPLKFSVPGAIILTTAIAFAGNIGFDSPVTVKILTGEILTVAGLLHLFRPLYKLHNCFSINSLSMECFLLRDQDPNPAALLKCFLI
jgi:hypothetical protein